MEFKFDGSAEEALKQIEEKGYAAPFANRVKFSHSVFLLMASLTNIQDYS